MAGRSSVYIILKPGISIPANIKEIINGYNAMFDSSAKGTLLHFQDVSWDSSFGDSSDVESFLAKLPKSNFLFIRVSSLDDVDLAGGYSNHPYRSVLPQNLLEFLDGF